MLTHTCTHCEREFKSERPTRRTCSNACRQAAYRKRIEDQRDTTNHDVAGLIDDLSACLAKTGKRAYVTRFEVFSAEEEPPVRDIAYGVLGVHDNELGGLVSTFEDPEAALDAVENPDEALELFRNATLAAAVKRILKLDDACERRLRLEAEARWGELLSRR